MWWVVMEVVQWRWYGSYSSSLGILSFWLFQDSRSIGFKVRSHILLVFHIFLFFFIRGPNSRLERPPKVPICLCIHNTWLVNECVSLIYEHSRGKNCINLLHYWMIGWFWHFPILIYSLILPWTGDLGKLGEVSYLQAAGRIPRHVHIKSSSNSLSFQFVCEQAQGVRGTVSVLTRTASSALADCPWPPIIVGEACST